ncbi:MAG: DUF6468 domain-containing protein [Pseudomonadota bacterium]
MFEIALEFILCLLMVPTIFWSVLIHRRLRRMRTDQGEMTAFIEALNETIVRAERAVGTLQAVGRETIERHDRQQTEAKATAEDVTRGIQSAARLLRRLDTALQNGTKTLAEIRTADQTSAFNQASSISNSVTPESEEYRLDGHTEDLDSSGAPQTAKGRDLLRALAALR